MEIINEGFGRVEKPDPRDKDFPISKILSEDNVPDITEKYWWANGWWGNQGKTTQCVAYSWVHWIEDGPVIQDSIENRPKPIYEPKNLYDLCQENDRWEGEAYNGTSVRAGAKILKHVGVISEYRWAEDINDVINTLKALGPMVVGTRWYSEMTHPNPKTSIINPRGKPAGGHAYILNGIDTELGLIRIKNSWGRQWGREGHAFISIDNFAGLLKNGGEACIAKEIKLDHIPKLLLG